MFHEILFWKGIGPSSLKVGIGYPVDWRGENCRRMVSWSSRQETHEMEKIRLSYLFVNWEEISCYSQLIWGKWIFSCSNADSSLSHSP